jgi:hypothetical protein
LLLGGAGGHDHPLAMGMDHSLRCSDHHHRSGIEPYHLFPTPGVKGDDLANHISGGLTARLPLADHDDVSEDGPDADRI